MTALERAIRELGANLSPAEMAKAVQGAADDVAAAARLCDWLAARKKD